MDLNKFFGQIVEVALYDGTRISGELVHMDCSKHGFMGNLILRTSKDLTIIRSDSVQSLALNPTIWIPEHLYNKFQRIADRECVDVDALVNGVLEVALDGIKNSNLMDVMQVG